MKFSKTAWAVPSRPKVLPVLLYLAVPQTLRAVLTVAPFPPRCSSELRGFADPDRIGHRRSSYRSTATELSAGPHKFFEEGQNARVPGGSRLEVGANGSLAT